MFAAFLGPAQTHHQLTVFPVLTEEDRDLPYLLMADAMATGVLTVQEVGHGHVPLLQATNKALDPILILDGEQLVGAKQNRMTNRSIILPPESVTRIPVSCMEHGRWHFVGYHFASAPQNAPSKVRRMARETEARSAERARDAETRGHRAPSSYMDLADAQGAVWSGIQEMSENLRSYSSTGALDSVYEDRRPEMERWLGAFPSMPDQVGILAFLGTNPLGLDALGAHAQYRYLHRRILMGYILDAMGARGSNRSSQRREKGTDSPVPTAVAQEFVERMKRARRTPSESVGSGEYSILDGPVLGGELVENEHLVHLSAFPNLNGNMQQEREDIPQSPIARPSHRRRRY
jgi:hypothetical protein